MRHAGAGENASREIAVFADAAISGRKIEARVGAERPERERLARRSRYQSGCRKNGEAEMCQHGAGLGPVKIPR